MVADEMQKCGILLSTYAHLLSRIYLDDLSPVTTKLHLDEIDDLIVLFPQRDDYDEVFPTTVTSCDEVRHFSKVKSTDFIPVAISDLLWRRLGVNGNGNKIYANAELGTARDKAVEIVAQGVANLYSDIGSHFGQEIFFACMRLWKSGPAMACARSNSNVRPQIINTWQRSEPLSDILLKKTIWISFPCSYKRTSSLPC